jgi:hypothetical protein
MMTKQASGTLCFWCVADGERLASVYQCACFLVYTAFVSNMEGNEAGFSKLNTYSPAFDSVS